MSSYYKLAGDEFYSRTPALHLPDALVRYVECSIDMSPGSRVVEDLQAKQDAMMKVIRAIALTLTPAQMAQVAQTLRMNPTSQDGQ